MPSPVSTSDGWPVLDSHCLPCVKVFGKPLISCHLSPRQQWWVVGGKRKLNCKWLAIAVAKCAKAELSSEEMRLYAREFQYQGYKLWSLMNSRGYQTINIHVYIYLLLKMKYTSHLLSIFITGYTRFTSTHSCILFPTHCICQHKV